MKIVLVVCIENRLTVPSRTGSTRTAAITRSVRSMICVRSTVATVSSSACTWNAPVADVTFSTGWSRTVTVERRGIRVF